MKPSRNEKNRYCPITTNTNTHTDWDDICIPFFDKNSDYDPVPQWEFKDLERTVERNDTDNHTQHCLMIMWISVVTVIVVVGTVLLTTLV